MAEKKKQEIKMPHPKWYICKECYYTFYSTRKKCLECNCENVMQSKFIEKELDYNITRSKV